jgi:putative aminopeptidase FrvX
MLATDDEEKRMGLDRAFLKRLLEAPAVGTACGPVVSLLTERFGEAYTRMLVPDGFCLFQKSTGTPEELEVVFVAHMDEIGGCVYGHADGIGFHTRVWGNAPRVFQEHPLQAMDWLATHSEEAFSVDSRLVQVEDEERLIVEGERIRPYRTVFTFRQETRFEEEWVYGKAIDPRATLYAVVEAVLRLDSPHVGALLVMAEECAMEVARKGVVFLQRCAPRLRLVVNADVPDIRNLADGSLEKPSLRYFEGRNFIDPSFGIQVAERLERDGVSFCVSGARSGSQTVLFTPLAPTLSVALPMEGVHTPCGRARVEGIQRCQELLCAIGEWALGEA